MTSDIIASGGAEPVTSAPDLITAIAAVSDALSVAENQAGAALTASELAALSLFNLQRSWYGFLAGNPSLDPNNNNPMSGAIYYNTTMNRLMIYDGVAWVSLVGIFITGSDAPGVDDGADGDFYVQMPAGTLYGPKAGGEWPAGIAIAGVGPVPWTAPTAWAGSTVYTVGPPASLVLYGGELYVCTTSHTSTASFDSSKWIKVFSEVSSVSSTDITDSTSFGRALLVAVSVAAQRTALGIGSAGLLTAGATGATLIAAATDAAGRSALNLGALATESQVLISEALLQDQKSSGTAGGTFTSGAWQTRTLNTEVYDTDSLVSISSNQFTPTANGIVEWSAPASEVGDHQTRLYNVTDSAVVAYGTSEYAEPSTGAQNRSFGSGPVVAGKAYRIEHRCEASITTYGLGNSNSFGGTQVYTTVIYRRTRFP
jgi:hypothetical protein